MQSLICLLFTVLGAYAPFTERGQVDFDLAIDSLKNSGSWVKITEGYAFLPKASENDPKWAPFRDGKWIYTDRGWMFEAANFESWITTHYGYWKRDSGKWYWIPLGYWQPAPVAWITTGDYIGWYPIKMGPLGELLGEIDVEKLAPENWSLYPIGSFSQSMKSENFAPAAQAPELLKKAQASYHKIKIWREVEYPGPAPAEIHKATGKDLKTRALRTLPTVDAEHPQELPDEYYLYRPKFFQDSEGIQKRIEIFIKRLKGDAVAAPKVRAAIGIEELEGQSPSTNAPSVTATSAPTNASTPTVDTSSPASQPEKTTSSSNSSTKTKTTLKGSKN